MLHLFSTTESKAEALSSERIGRPRLMKRKKYQGKLCGSSGKLLRRLQANKEEYPRQGGGVIFENAPDYMEPSDFHFIKFY